GAQHGRARQRAGEAPPERPNIDLVSGATRCKRPPPTRPPPTRSPPTRSTTTRPTTTQPTTTRRTTTRPTPTPTWARTSGGLRARPDARDEHTSRPSLP